MAPIARLPPLPRDRLRARRDATRGAARRAGRAARGAVRDGAIVGCLVLAVAHLLGLLDIGVDAYTYWTADPSAPYGATSPGTAQAYFYSPAFAQLSAPIHLLPWNVFIALWTVLLAVALVWQAGLWT